jgi:hypothetical protein
MAAFPTLTPSAAPITPGAWPVATISSLSGAESRIRQGSAQIGRRLQLTFANITEANFLAILNHYRGQRSGFDSFGFNTATLAADLTPAGYAWLYASRPQVVDEHADVFTVVCEFKAEPRGLVVAIGKTWRTLATTLTPGARDGGIVYGPGTAWMTSSTTFVPGERTNGLDPYFSSVSLLLHMNGSNGSTTFTDSSSNGLAIAATGNAQISTTQSKFGNASGNFDGSGDYLTVNNSSVNIAASQDFTWEAWIYPLSLGGYKCIVKNGDSSTGTPHLYLSNSLLILWESNSSKIAHQTNVVVNQWQHVALVRAGNVSRIYLDGISSSDAYSWSASTSNILTIGSDAGGIGQDFNGYIDEVRVTKGVARFTSTFSPSSNPFPDS